MPMMVDGSFRPLETDSSGLIGRLLHQNPISTNPIDLHPPKFVIIRNLRQSSVKSVYHVDSTRSHQIWQNFGQIL